MAQNFQIATTFKAIDQMTAPVKGMRKNVERLSHRLRASSAQVRKMGTSALVGGAIMTSAFVGVGQTVFKFEQEINALQAATNASASEMKMLRGQAMDLGRTTQFSASQVATAQKLAGQAGFNTTKIMAAMPGVLNLAAAGQLEMGEATDIATSIMAGFNIKAQGMTRVSDVIAASATSAKTTVSEMGIAISKAAPLANTLGISLEQTSAAVAILQNKGIAAEEAGVGFRNMMIRLLDPVKSARDAMEEFGVDSDWVAEQMGKGKWDVILKRFNEAGLDAAAMTTIFGARAANMALILGPAVDEVNKLTTSLENSGGAAQRMAEQQMAGLVGSFKTMMSRVESLMLNLGDSGLTGIMIKMLDTVTRGIDIFMAMPAPIKTIAVAVLAAGPLLIGLGIGLQAIAFSLSGLAILVAGGDETVVCDSTVIVQSWLFSIPN